MKNKRKRERRARRSKEVIFLMLESKNLLPCSLILYQMMLKFKYPNKILGNQLKNRQLNKIKRL
jgi:hypothetical protein